MIRMTATNIMYAWFPHTVVYHPLRDKLDKQIKNCDVVVYWPRPYNFTIYTAS